LLHQDCQAVHAIGSSSGKGMDKIPECLHPQRHLLYAAQFDFSEVFP